MTSARLLVILVAVLAGALFLSILIGETAMSSADYLAAFTQRDSSSAEILWSIRAPRAVMAALAGAALGLAGAALQGLLRNPLADPGVLGVSASASLGAGLSISLGLVAIPFAIEGAALAGALACGAIVVVLAARFRTPEALILVGVALSAFAGALTALVYNFAASPLMATEVLTWMLGSVANRDWPDALTAAVPMAVGAALVFASGRGLTMLTLGEETAAMSGLPMARLRAMAVAGASILTGAAVAASGVIGFVGLAAPHIVRRWAGDDPDRTLAPSALSGAILLVAADLAGRLIPTEQELKLGVLTALFGAPLFALIAWRAARSWRA